MGYIYLEDSEPQPHQPVSRILTKDDMRALYPMRPPRQLTFIFKHDKPMDMELECKRKGFPETETMRITSKLKEKYDTISISAHSPVQDDDLDEMSIQELRVLGMRHGIRWRDLTVPKDQVRYMIYRCRAKGIEPYSAEEWDEIREQDGPNPVQPYTELVN